METFSLKAKVTDDDPIIICDFIAHHTKLSKIKTKDAISKGAAWVKRQGRKSKRVKRVKHKLQSGDMVMFYYNESVLNQKPPQATCLSDHRLYSIWFKPVDLMTQATQYADHNTMMRQVEQHFKNRKVFLVHRLDKEASGIILFAHTKDAAAKFSQLFSQHKIEKQYQIRVKGNLTLHHASGKIDLPLDDKPCLTRFECIEYEPTHDTSVVRVFMQSGRLHQIRRHFDLFGFPVMGDPAYGKGNKNTQGLQLAATSLAFICPFTQKNMHFAIPNDLNLISHIPAGKNTD